ncbi:unnamed protein product [Closterium sp. NIES-53]
MPTRDLSGVRELGTPGVRQASEAALGGVAAAAGVPAAQLRLCQLHLRSRRLRRPHPSRHRHRCLHLHHRHRSPHLCHHPHPLLRLHRHYCLPHYLLQIPCPACPC